MTTADAATQPIPVVRVPPAGEPLPAVDLAGGVPAQDVSPGAAPVHAPGQSPEPPPVVQAPVEQAPAAHAQAAHAQAAQAPADDAAADQVLADQVPAGQAPAGPDAAPEAAAQQAPVEQAASQRSGAQQPGAQQPGAGQAADRAEAQRAADEATVRRAARLLARQSSLGRNRRLAGLAAGLLLVIAGVTVGVALLGSGGHPRHPARADSAGTVVTNRDHAAAWVASQVSRDAMVSCDPVTCVVIESHGFPASHVRALGTGTGAPLSSDLVVATPAIRHQFGARLTSVYAPGLLASFGAGGQQVDVRVVAPHGAAAYQAELRADLQNRRMSGAGLSGSNRIQAPVTARNQLASGRVDSRLMITLALMASLHPLHLMAFGDGGPDPAAAPFRSVELSLTGSAQKQSMLSFLSQQRPPYAPAHVTTRRTGPNQIILVMEFAAPSPVGLFH
jgi:hypothetical protein